MIIGAWGSMVGRTVAGVVCGGMRSTHVVYLCFDDGTGFEVFGTDFSGSSRIRYQSVRQAKEEFARSNEPCIVHSEPAPPIDPADALRGVYIGTPDPDVVPFPNKRTQSATPDPVTEKTGANPGVHSPLLAERAFLFLARRWHERVKVIGGNATLPEDADTLALSCLLLAVEWGSGFTVQAERQIEVNREALDDRGPTAWIDQLSWDLCRASNALAPSESEAVRQLTGNLAHNNSSIRGWMMELGWIAHSWLDEETAMTPLLGNIANTLVGPFMAAGLAAMVAGGDDEFWARAQRFVSPSGFEDQYRARIDLVRDHSILSTQAFFLEREVECRRIIEQVALGQSQGPRRSESPGDDKRSGSDPRPQQGISQEMARGIVASYLSRKTHFGEAPLIYGVDLSDCWVAYVEEPSGMLMIRSSEIVAVSKKTGEIVYAGSAHDEG